MTTLLDGYYSVYDDSRCMINLLLPPPFSHPVAEYPQARSSYK